MPANKPIADARRKADIYAKAAGVTLGDAAQHHRGQWRVRADVSRRMARRPDGGNDAAVAQGEETLSVTVSVSWAIKQGPP